MMKDFLLYNEETETNDALLSGEADTEYKMELAFKPETLGESLGITLKGMVGIFVVILSVILVIGLIGAATKRRKKAE